MGLRGSGPHCSHLRKALGGISPLGTPRFQESHCVAQPVARLQQVRQRGLVQCAARQQRRILGKGQGGTAAGVRGSGV